MKQIKCKNFRGIMVDALYNYDELSGEDKRLFHAHLAICPACAGEYKEMAAVLGVMDQRQRPEMGEEFWDSYYLRLLEKIKKAEKVSLIKSFCGGFRGAVFSKRAPLIANNLP
ncbi:MAG: zf-HC2 domain-containing protein, partial [Candidatus Aminicenantes bacterium]